MFPVKILRRMRHTFWCCDYCVLSNGISSHSQKQRCNDVSFHVLIFIFAKMNEDVSPLSKQDPKTQSTLDELCYQTFCVHCIYDFLYVSSSLNVCIHVFYILFHTILLTTNEKKSWILPVSKAYQIILPLVTSN